MKAISIAMLLVLSLASMQAQSNSSLTGLVTDPSGAVVPGAEVVAERVGLRPYRPTVRLEAESLPGGRVLWHNYGHGGGGVSLSWGCARDLTDAVLTGATA